MWAVERRWQTTHPSRPPSGFEFLFTEHQRSILSYTMRRARSTADAEDAAAETFTIAWRKLDAIPTDEPLPWLYAIARRVLANQRRGAGRRERLAALLHTHRCRHIVLDVPDASLARVSARVEEHVMTDIRTGAARRRRPLALAGGLTMALGLAVAVAAGPNLGPVPASTDDPGGNPAAGGGGMAMCLAYDPANLPTMEVVFDGTVTAINGDQVTFQVNEGWKGVGDSITLTAPDTDVALLGDMPDFEVGGRYLVTAAGSDINACNYTLDYDADEAADWAAAFED